MHPEIWPSDLVPVRVVTGRGPALSGSHGFLCSCSHSRSSPVHTVSYVVVAAMPVLTVSYVVVPAVDGDDTHTPLACLSQRVLPTRFKCMGAMCPHPKRLGMRLVTLTRLYLSAAGDVWTAI